MTAAGSFDVAPRLINLTPHPLTLESSDGNRTVIEPSGVVARVSASPGELRQVLGVPVLVAAPDVVGEVIGLPDPEPLTFYIVSGLVGAAVKGRADVLVPGTGPKDGAIRNEKGHVIAVTRLKMTFK